MAKIAGDKSDIIKAVPMACADEDTAVEFLEDMRWEREPSCPRCGDVDVYMMKDRKTGERSSRYLWRCRGCARQFTVRIGTIMEDSRIPMRHWCFAFWAACSSKKGVSALQIKRQTGLTYKSALFLMHRVRYAMNGAANSGPLSGDVEHDATYVGGKIRPRTNRGKRRPRGYKRMENKTPVIAVVERSGQARAEVTTNVTSANLAKHIRENVDPGAARLHTDEASQGEFKRSSQHLRKEEELRWRQASADGRIELCVRRWVHPVVPRWGAGSIGRGFGKKLLEGCRARSRRWQPACLPLLGRAGFANVVACHLSVFVLCRGATYRSSSEKRLRFFKPAVVAYVRSPGSCAAHRRRSRENCGGTQQREVETSSIEPRPPNGMPIGERSVRKLPNSLRTAN